MNTISSSAMGEASFALGRLAMAVDRSPLRSLWLSHETARVVATLFSRGVEPISPETLLAMSAGLPTGSHSINEAAARRFWGQALRLWRSRVAVEPTGTVPEITNLLADLSRGDIPPGDLALEAPLRMASLTCWALPCIALALPGADRTEPFDEAFISGLGRESAAALSRLEALERDHSRWVSALPSARSDSRLRDAVVLLGTMHALTPRYVVETLGLTRQAAARLLRKLESLGIVRQQAERQRWLVYVAENAARSVPENTSPAPDLDISDVQAIDRALDAAYQALDRSLRRDNR
ncbi:MAG: helix-turn-helix domain-containing protein [Pseudomonadota bacterium]